MPMPTPRKNEDQKAFISRAMGDETMRRDYPDEKQRAAVAYSQWRRSRRKRLEKVLLDTQEKVKTLVSELREVTECRWIEKDEPMLPSDGKFVATCELCKIEDADDHTFVWGPVLIPETVDKQGDIISAEEIEEAAHGFLEDSGRPGLLHRVMLGSRDATIVESGLLRAPYKVSKDQTLPVGTWVLGMNVYNEKVRKLIISGKLKGYSIGGQGVGIEE